MKKNRNSFFSEYNMTSMNMPGMDMQPNMMMPNQTFAANSSLYAGPMPNANMYSDIDARLSKIERELKRLEARINHLEGDNQTNINIDEYNSNPMYML